MTVRKRNYLWPILLLALFIAGAERIAASLGPERRDVRWSDTNSRHDPAAPAPELSPGLLAQAVRLIPLYPAGSLLVEGPPEPATKTEIPKKNRLEEKTSAAALAADASMPPAAPPAVSLDGELPALEVDYKDIGFARYLDVSERIGRFFVLVENADGRKAVGPEVSLTRSTVSRTGGADMATLATQRPHLVSGDPMIRQRLSAMDMPAGAIKDSLILYLTKPFDAVLWNAIGDAVAKQGLRLADVDRVKGSYLADRRGVFLRLESATVRNERRAVPLIRFVRVTL